MSTDTNIAPDDTPEDPNQIAAANTPTEPGTTKPVAQEVAKEIGGPKEADPTRYGDWTVKGRCIDF